MQPAILYDQPILFGFLAALTDESDGDVISELKAGKFNEVAVIACVKKSRIQSWG